MAIGNTDTVPAMLTPGEFVIKRESADMLGLPFLRQLNSVSDNAAHGNIDALIGQAQLEGMSPMTGGGYQDGDVVEKQSLLTGLLSMLFGAGKRQKAYEENVPPSQQFPPMPYSGVNWRAPFADEHGRGLETPDEAYERSGVEDRQMLRRFKIGYDEKGLPEPQDLARIILTKLSSYEDEWNPPQDVNIPQRGYQAGDMVQDQNDPLDIDARQANPDIYAGSVIQGAGGGMPNPASVLDRLSPQDSLGAINEAQDSLNALKATKLMEFLKQLEISKNESIEYNENDILPPWKNESIEYNKGDALPPLRGKRNFKGQLFEDFLVNPLYRERGSSPLR